MSAFLESEIGILTPEQAFFHILPVPYEATVSYGNGTANGPEAILTASQQLEIWDGFSIPARKGIYTWQAVKSQQTPQKEIEAIEQAVAAILPFGMPVLLGGEHSITTGALQALKKRYGTFGVVQFDAHADLRNSYEGSPYSHACVMHRALDLGLPVFQLGVRSLSPEEVKLRQERKIGFLDAYTLHTTELPATILPPNFPQNIYISFDVDGLDPSVIPGTGTPEPGGLSFIQAMILLQKIIAERNTIGFDAVELAPLAGQHLSEFTVARLIYNIMGIIERKNEKPL